ncbi:MAG TPA: EAL domain-containing protein [Actinotalea sp.]
MRSSAGYDPDHQAWLLWLLGLALVGYLIALALSIDVNAAMDLWLPILIQWLPAAVCWVAVYRSRRRSWEVLFSAAAVTAFASGNSYYYLALPVTGSAPPFPSPADVGYLSFTPLILIALTVAVRRRLPGLGWSVWLDSVLGSLAAASVLAGVLSPVLLTAEAGSWSLATVVSLAYPLADMAMVAAVIGIITLQDLRVGRQWMPLIAALVIFTGTDVIYALQVAAGTYQPGTLLDGGWDVGLALVAVWVHGWARAGIGAPRPAPVPVTSAPLAVPSVAMATGLCMLVVGTQTHVTTLAVVLAGGTLLGAAVRTQVVFRQLVQMADLRRQARVDELTGLPNRRALYTDASTRLAARGRQQQALLLLDLDKFKEVNDSLGHHAGDQLLVEVGRRLREQLRDGDLLARLGGDEFAVLVDNADHELAGAVAVKLRQALVEPFALEGVSLRTDVSIGIALSPEHGAGLSLLLRRADVAMYKAKTARSGHHIYVGKDDTHGDARLRTLEELHTALATGDQVVLHYQPKIDLATGDVRGVEALVRWDHPTRGLLYPAAFLYLVEEGGLMRSLTQVVLEKALDQAVTWRSNGTPLTIAVNVSASSLVDADLPENIAALLTARGLPPTALQLEITEEFLMADRDRARGILTRLRDQGIQIAVDDFGTGYSSLAYLRELPVDELKLDRSFIFPMADDARAAALVASTIALAHSLGLRMVAEGVEDHVAYTELARHGCDQAQGFYMSRPVPAAELDHWLTARSSLGIPSQATHSGGEPGSGTSRSPTTRPRG